MANERKAYARTMGTDQPGVYRHTDDGKDVTFDLRSADPSVIYDLAAAHVGVMLKRGRSVEDILTGQAPILWTSGAPKKTPTRPRNPWMLAVAAVKARQSGMDDVAAMEWVKSLTKEQLKAAKANSAVIAEHERITGKSVNIDAIVGGPTAETLVADNASTPAVAAAN